MKIVAWQAQGKSTAWRPTAKKMLLAAALLNGPAALAHVPMDGYEYIGNTEKGRVLEKIPLDKPPIFAPELFTQMMDICDQAGGKLNGPYIAVTNRADIYDFYECARGDDSPLDAQKIVPDRQERESLLKQIGGTITRVLFLWSHDTRFPAPPMGSQVHRK